MRPTASLRTLDSIEGVGGRPAIQPRIKFFEQGTSSVTNRKREWKRLGDTASFFRIKSVYETDEWWYLDDLTRLFGTHVYYSGGWCRATRTQVDQIMALFFLLEKDHLLSVVLGRPSDDDVVGLDFCAKCLSLFPDTINSTVWANVYAPLKDVDTVITPPGDGIEQYRCWLGHTNNSGFMSWR